MTTQTSDLAVQGTVAEGYEPVREEFAALLAAEPELAAQVAAHVDGRRVVDLWGGPGMAGDSLLGVFSSTKGAAFLVVALLAQEGALDLDREVAAYWPEFAAAGKAGVTVRELLGHRAGLVGVDGGFSLAEVADDAALAERLAPQRPYWRPGTAFGYHSLTIGALAAELVRRVSGATLRDVYRARLAGPHDVDFHLGVPASELPRVIDVLPPRPPAVEPAPIEPDSLAGIAYNLQHPSSVDLAALPNLPEIRAGGPASVGGVGSARGLAALYAAGLALLTPDTLAECAQPYSTGRDLVLGMERAHGLGFMVAAPYLGARAFGHDGAGGSMAFADPAAGLAFGYTRRRVPTPGGAGPDAERLATTTRACVRRRRR
ncbi:serine hydrolase domain-containing protein [Streptomyces hainanensis]|uniref:Class A beta-lactamase-related serine hydrolase n=1 Tax=Streptomyces hainanensis TaxID=402648 RepID=A0A4R4TNU7_9ACTN|nr:serine hydrolase domain-containing protein [Streptomyces hainanensis]TDC79560.1 class A beta-lactamase-related serine hydrolase [Streptomyces hainanensis]